MFVSTSLVSSLWLASFFGSVTSETVAPPHETIWLGGSREYPGEIIADIGFDLMSNGRYWWGWPWTHKPQHGDTQDCICFIGRGRYGGKNGYCTNGITWNSRSEVTHVWIKDGNLDASAPNFGTTALDIRTYGSDALWIDRFEMKFESGRGRVYGSHNTSGYCLSTDPNETPFDKWATHDKCWRTLTLWRNGQVQGSNDGGYYKGYLEEESKAACARFRRGRRMEGDKEVSGYFITEGSVTPVEAEDDGAAQVPSSPPLPVEQLDEEGELSLDEDPTGPHPAVTHTQRDADVVAEVHKAIRLLVLENAGEAVTDEQIEAALNGAMLAAEHLEEQREIEAALNGAMLAAEHLEEQRVEASELRASQAAGKE